MKYSGQFLARFCAWLKTLGRLDITELETFKPKFYESPHSYSTQNCAHNLLGYFLEIWEGGWMSLIKIISTTLFTSTSKSLPAKIVHLRNLPQKYIHSNASFIDCWLTLRLSSLHAKNAVSSSQQQILVADNKSDVNSAQTAALKISTLVRNRLWSKALWHLCVSPLKENLASNDSNNEDSDRNDCRLSTKLCQRYYTYQCNATLKNDWSFGELMIPP